MKNYPITNQYLYHNYHEIEEKMVPSAGITHRDIQPVLDRYADEKGFLVADVGFSAESRILRGVEIGHGKTKLFFWSQMHGDEATATASLFDIFNFFSSGNTHFTHEKERVLSQLTMVFLPMVNPDGAERIIRHNAHGIDINRDARALRSREATILMDIFRKMNPHYAFNLHDQNARYSAGDSGKQVLFAFLAPPPDFEKTMTENRMRAISVVQALASLSESYFPGHYARYADDYEPRAFGDTFQSLGAATVLLECGGWKDDPDKTFVRKMHTILLVDVIFQITYHHLPPLSLEHYTAIPENTSQLHDLVLRNAVLGDGAVFPIADIGINKKACPGLKASEITECEVAEIGDLGGTRGINEIDCSGLYVRAVPESKANDVRSILLHTEPENGLKSLYLRIQSGQSLKIGSHPCFFLARANHPKYFIEGTCLFDLERMGV